MSSRCINLSVDITVTSPLTPFQAFIALNGPYSVLFNLTFYNDKVYDTLIPIDRP